MTEIPTALYAFIGVMVLTNLSTFGVLIVFIFKVGMFVADTNSGIKDAKGSAVRAHKRIDILEQNSEG